MFHFADAAENTHRTMKKAGEFLRLFLYSQHLQKALFHCALDQSEPSNHNQAFHPCPDGQYDDQSTLTPDDALH